MFEKEEEDDDEEEEEEEEDNVSEGSEVPESDRPAGAQHHQINGERGPPSAKERVKEWSPCGPYQGQDEGRGPAPGSCTRQVFSMTATNKEGGSGKDPSGLGQCRAGSCEPKPDCRLLSLSQLVLQLLQILHLLCLCLQENQPYLGLMGPLLAVRKLRHWGH